MPALIPKAFTEQQERFVWVCSDCDQPFSTAHPPNERVKPDIQGVNRDFAHHRWRRHPKTVMVALPQFEEHKTTLVDTFFGWLRTVRLE